MTEVIAVRGAASDDGARGPSARVLELVAGMGLEAKLAQLVGYWVDRRGDKVAPMADVMGGDTPLGEATRHGLGHFTRVYGTHPVDPQERAAWLHQAQRTLVETTGLPAIVHEECLTGLAAWGATTFPTPLAWGASFDPALVGEMAASVGEQMRSLGIHQGLSPVLDVVRDARWGRVEECLGEDPYLVGELGTAYVRGLQSGGVLATLKHFVGYSASWAGRNLAPVSAGPREIADTLLIPFEMALLDGGARSVMHSYTEIDGVPVAADPRLLTDLLRGTWGFDGTVVADYFGVAFLHTLHGVAADLGDAAGQALAAGIDVELPTLDAFAGPLRAAIDSGAVPIELIDRALIRVLAQKEELGLLDADFSGPAPEVPADLDPPAMRDIARRMAERSVVLLSNDGTLPRRGGRIAVIGPNAHRTDALYGCYSFVNHVLPHHPGVPDGIEAATVLEAVRAENPGAEITYAEGCGVDDPDPAGIAEAVARAAEADVAYVVVGDRSGLFGRGTSGEGCDVDTLELPGLQRRLVEEVLATGTPVVLVLITGRPYAIGWALERCAAVVQAFFPGEEGAGAVAGVLSGSVAPSGRLPVSIPRSAGAMPYTYRGPLLGGPNQVTNLDPSPPLAFGHGLTYTTFEHRDLTVAPAVAGGALEVSLEVANTGDRAGTDVVQLYAHDVVAQVTRPAAQLLAFTRVDLAPGERARVHLSVPTTRLAYSDRDLVRIVEPGEVELWAGPDCRTRETATTVVLAGDRYAVGPKDEREVTVRVERIG